jgi:hypothetical protein
MEKHGMLYSFVMRDPDTLKRRLAAVVKKQRAALDELQAQLTKTTTTPAGIEKAQRAVDHLSAQYQRVAQELKVAELEKTERYGSYNVRSGQRPMREVVLDILDEIGVPCSPGTLSECSAVWAGIWLPAGRFASVRRDEQTAFARDAHSRPAWLVPALNAVGFRAIPRSVASSVWEPERRLIGPRTLRVNHLKTVLALLRRLSALRQSGSSPSEERLAELLQRYARSVPGAVASGEEMNPDRIQQAAEAELAAIEPLDADDRKAAALELLKVPPYNQLWGLPGLIEGQSAAIRRAAGR